MLVIFWQLLPIHSQFLVFNKNIRFDFDDELKIKDVRYKHLTYKS